jgi:TolB-like protein
MSTTDPLLLDGTGGNKKRKVRSSWISFVGRIVAQVIGAAASILLFLTFIQPAPASSAATAATAAVAGTDTDRSFRAAVVRDPRHVTIAVLPLANHSGDATQDFLAQGMTQALIADLAQIKRLHVISRTSVSAYAGSNKSLPQVADELGADVIVEGAIVRVGDQLRVRVQLIDGARDYHLWTATYDRVLTDILSMERELSGEIAGQIRAALLPIEQARLRHSETPASSGGN